MFILRLNVTLFKFIKIPKIYYFQAAQYSELHAQRILTV